MHLPRAPAASRLDGTPKHAVHRRLHHRIELCQSVLDPGSGATGFGRMAGFDGFGGGANAALASAVGMGVVFGVAGPEVVLGVAVPESRLDGTPKRAVHRLLHRIERCH